jgi:hypothetical protein
LSLAPLILNVCTTGRGLFSFTLLSLYARETIPIP